MSHAKLVVLDRGKEIELGQLDAGESIKSCCEEAGVPFACEEGICGTCIIEVMEGNDHLSDYNESEEDFWAPSLSLANQDRVLSALLASAKSDPAAL